MMETTGSGRLDNGNQNEPVRMPDEIMTRTLGKSLFSGRLLDGRISKVPGYRFNILKVKGTEKTKGKGEDERERERGKRKGKLKWRRRNISKVYFKMFDDSLDIPEFNISKVWWFLSLNVWNLAFQRFSPASTSASNI
ncbi:unnamed protein product [Rhizophagus irregularis]|nr:unnamed protein product [Rhizophagus irregularis]